jgi:cytochrome d ubiquinol oxidase subunit II
MGLETVWFLLAAAMVAAYVVLDGFDLGAGILHVRAGRDERDRALVLRSIGPVWDGNEVWLLAAGGVIVLAFPLVYAASFSGFYLPLMLVLWLLIGRACAVEFRHQVSSPVWTPFWDRIFQVSSALLAVCFGAALGNVVRGVPFGPDGQFFEPLWNDPSRTTGETGILDWYTVLVGATALAALAMHGGAWLALKLEGEPAARARSAVRGWWWAVAGTTALVTIATFSVQPHVPERLRTEPWIHAFPALAVAGLIAVRWSVARGRDLATFLASSAYLLGMLARSGSTRTCSPRARTPPARSRSTPPAPARPRCARGSGGGRRGSRSRPSTRRRRTATSAAASPLARPATTRARRGCPA